MTAAFLDEALHLTREHADLYVEQVGPADAPAVLFLHGGPGASSHPFRELLGDDLERYRMVYLDQRGGGRSYADAPFGLDELADDAAAVLAALRLPRATVLAHGFGASVAVRLAGRHPDRLRGQVWLNPWLSMPTLARTLWHEALALSAAASGALSEPRREDPDDAGDPEALVDEAFALVGAKPLLDALLFPDPASRLRLEHAAASVLHGPSESAGLHATWSVDVVAELPACRAPVAVLLATGDRTCFPDQAELALGHLPHAMTAMLDGGHHLYLDDPEAFLGALVEALAHAGAAT